MNNYLVSIILDDVRSVIYEIELETVKDKSILISGASGLVGIYILAIIRVASELGFGPMQVVTVMRSEASFLVKQIMKGIETTYIYGDISEKNILDVHDTFDLVIHSAGYAQPLKFLEDPVTTIKLNTSGSFNMLDKLAPGGRYLFVSSSEVYTGAGDPPFSEQQIGVTSTNHPRACYIEGKRTGEAICHAYRSQGVFATVARLALAYGPGTRMNDQRVLNTIIQQGLLDKVIRLKDQGLARRTYCYAADAASIMWNVLTRGMDCIYNVGGVSRTSIAEIASIVSAELNVPLIIPEQSTWLAGAPVDVELNVDKVRAEFGKNRFTQLHAGLERTIKWQEALYLDQMSKI